MTEGAFDRVYGSVVPDGSAPEDVHALAAPDAEPAYALGVLRVAGDLARSAEPVRQSGIGRLLRRRQLYTRQLRLDTLRSVLSPSGGNNAATRRSGDVGGDASGVSPFGLSLPRRAGPEDRCAPRRAAAKAHQPAGSDVRRPDAAV